MKCEHWNFAVLGVVVGACGLNPTPPSGGTSGGHEASSSSLGPMDASTESEDPMSSSSSTGASSSSTGSSSSSTGTTLSTTTADPSESATGATHETTEDGATISGTTHTGGESSTSEDIPSGPVTLWIAGDSTVANGSTPCPRGWGGAFESLFTDDVTVMNLAVGGRSIRTWLYAVQSAMGPDGECLVDQDPSGMPVLQDRWVQTLEGLRPGDYLFIQFGINDGSSTCDRHVGEAQYGRELAMMANAAVERGAQPIFLTPVSMIRCAGTQAVGSRGFLEITLSTGEQLDVPVIDLHQRSVDLYDTLGFCPLPGGASDVSSTTPGEVGAFFCDDHTHFDAPGATAIAQVVADALVEQQIGLAHYLR